MTSISKLIVGGFKSIRDRTEIPIAPITLLFGPNSAGKSAVLSAVNTLRERIEERPTKGNFRSALPLAIANGSAYFDFKQKTCADDGEGPLFGDSPNVNLGVEIEDFPANIDPENLSNRGEFCGRALCWAIDGSSTQVEIEEFYWEEQFRDSYSRLGVDQVDLLKFQTDGIAGQAIGLPMTLEFEHWNSNTGVRDRLNLLGVLSINLTHPIWTLKSILDSAANFERRLDKDSAIEFDKHRVELGENLRSLKNAALTTTSPFLKQLIILDGDWLHIRSDVNFLSVKTWSPTLFYSGINSSFSDLWSMAGLDVQQEEDNLPVIHQVNEVLEAISCFGTLVRGSIADCLRVTAIDGDRQMLKPEDVTVQFPVFYANDLAVRKFWTTPLAGGVGSNREVFSFYTGPEANSFLSLYAFWLGCSTVASSTIPMVKKEMLVEREDFVNFVLQSGVFGARRYKVKPTVWSITTKPLVHRDIQQADNDEDHEETDIKVQLYLEDQNGRRLDFSEVGSGISYVMPILASLHGAKTSWIAQPELHLHPAAQCEMGDVFLRAFNRGHFSVVETHSEHLLLRVLRRIRQTTKGAAMEEDLKCPPEAISVLYFDPQEDGSTQIRQLRVTRLGDFKDRWPNGFFEERGRELFDE